MKYFVEYEFRNGRDEWVRDFLNNNGEGYIQEDAEYIAYQIKTNSILARYVEVKEMQEGATQ